MNSIEVEALKDVRADLEDAWWACDTSEAEEFLNDLIDRVDTKLREMEKK